MKQIVNGVLYDTERDHRIREMEYSSLYKTPKDQYYLYDEYKESFEPIDRISAFNWLQRGYDDDICRIEFPELYLL
jgi:hypothetical protein